jgi:hypothetical protein
MKKIILLLAITVLSNSKSNSQTLSQNNWNSYCGWHYGNTPAWGGWVREFVQHSTGYDLIDTAGTTLVIDTVKLNSLLTSLSTINSEVDIMQLDGGLGQAKDTVKAKGFINMIKADSAAFWKSLILKQCNKLAQLPNSQNRLYYQLGNEITSAALSSSIRNALGLPYSGGSDYDQFVISSFVELYMAPTIEAIDSSSALNFGAKGKINICLGSVTNAGNNAAKPFTDALLNYTITGAYAPSLAGKKVYELINIITIHYMMGNSSKNVWENKINEYANWIGTGRIKGVWSTEEVGINKASSGAGAAYSARATFRYLKWAIANNYTSKVVRTNYWAWDGGPANTQVSNFNTELFNFLGNVKLGYVNPLHTSFIDSSNMEWHGLITDSTYKKAVLVVPGTTTQTITQVKLAKNGWGNVSSVSLTRYDTTGNYNIPVTLTSLTDSVLLTFPVQTLSVTSVLLFKINILQVVTSAGSITDYKKYISIYPVPTSGIVHVKILNQNLESIKIYSARGELIRTSNSAELDISNFPSGVYLISVQTDKTSLNEKIIKL